MKHVREVSDTTLRVKSVIVDHKQGVESQKFLDDVHLVMTVLPSTHRNNTIVHTAIYPCLFSVLYKDFSELLFPRLPINGRSLLCHTTTTTHTILIEDDSGTGVFGVTTTFTVLHGAILADVLPNFLIIGATKAGTTSLHHYLDQHPDIFMCPRKETNFFAQESALCLLEETIKEREAYEKLFEAAGNTQAVGETSPAYLAVPTSPAQITALIPHAKFIAVLRDPAERAYSHFLMRRRQGKEFRESFAQCIEEEDIDPARSYKHRGLYGEQLQRYLKYFPPKQLKIFLYENFVERPEDLLREAFTFLDVESSFTPDMSERYNANPPAEPLSDAMRRKLIELYQGDILKLQRLLGKDLSTWLT